MWLLSTETTAVGLCGETAEEQARLQKTNL